MELKLVNNEQLDIDSFEVSGNKNVLSDESDIVSIKFAQTKNTIQYGDILNLDTQVLTNTSEENKQNQDNEGSETEGAKTYKGEIVYTSSDIAVASVSQNGMVYANGAGKAVITASANGVSASFEVNAAKLEVTKSSGIRVGAGEKVVLKAKLKNGTTNGTDKIKWSADDTSKVKISSSSDGSATIKTNKKGDVTITASYGEYSTKTVIHIRRAPSKITPDEKNMTLKKGKKRKIGYELPVGSISSKITYSSSNKKIATVSSAGVVKAKKKGKCTITLRTFNGKSAKVKIKVK